MNPIPEKSFRTLCRMGFALFSTALVAYGSFPAGTPITPYLIGQNDWLNPPSSGFPIIMDSGVTIIRIGGHQYDVTPFSNTDLLAQVDLIRSIGAEPLIQVPRDAGAAAAASTVQFINVTNARAVKFWSIGNEPDLNYPGTTAQLMTYIQGYIMTIAPAMRDVDPTINISAPELSSYNQSKYAPLLGGSNDITGKDGKGRYYVDCITFHSYPFGNTFTQANVLTEMHSNFENNKVVPLVNLINSANSLHNRTGAAALTWGLTEFNMTYDNPSNNNPAGLGVSSFLNGQLFAEYYRVAMKYGTHNTNTWSLLEGGGAGASGDLGYLGGTWNAPVKRSSYYHMQMMADYMLPGGYLPSTSNYANLVVLSTSSTSQTVLSMMLLNEDTTGSQNFTVRMDNNAVVGSGVAINVAAGLAHEFSGTIGNQSTVVLTFDTSGALLQRITYSLASYQANLAPTVETFFMVAPTFSPAAGTYSSAQSVTIATTTVGASIRYTTDGSAPTETNGTLYSGPVSIGATTTLKAIAYKTGLNDSSVTSGTFTISPAATPTPPAASGGGGGAPSWWFLGCLAFAGILRRKLRKAKART